MNTSDWHGRTLQAALSEQPSLQLSFYSFGVILRKATPDGAHTEFPVDPDELSRALSAKTVFTTGLMTDDIIYMRQEGVKQTVVSYRPRQRTGIWLEGYDEALRVPLPDLLLIQITTDGKTPDYSLFAVKERPRTLDAPLFHVPLPNVFSSGNICWGNIQLKQSSHVDWQTLLGTRFGSHAVSGKSRQYRDDVRKMLLDLNGNQRRRVYPRSDLISANKSLGKVLGITEDAS